VAHEDSIAVGIADESHRAAIYAKRHDVFALELEQHRANEDRQLRDALDAHNIYVVATRGAEVLGFTSITPPGSPAYAIDRYWPRSALPFVIDDHVGEIRLLVVDRALRGNGLAYLLLYGAYRLCRVLGATRIVGTGHSWITDVYRQLGMQTPGLQAPSGKLVFDLVVGDAAQLDVNARAFLPLFRQIRDATGVEWRFDFPFEL